MAPGSDAGVDLLCAFWGGGVRGGVGVGKSHFFVENAFRLYLLF